MCFNYKLRHSYSNNILAFCVRINFLASSPTFSHSSDLAFGVRVALG